LGLIAVWDQDSFSRALLATFFRWSCFEKYRDAHQDWIAAEQELRGGAGEVGRVWAEEHSDTPVDPELADGSEPIVDNPSPGYSVSAANHRKIVGVEYTTGGGSSAGKAQQVIAPGRDNPLAA